ncbi:MAG TPA: NADH:ubiquinone reductase (Na(+)-transporting) subunit C [bacterium]|nr:NADH:ubiquinone reductase (Na(+)-transporting) subunit C [bacterium]
MSENLKVIRFAVIVCLVCSALVSAAALGLRERQEANLLLDIRKNILKSVSLYQPTLADEEVNRLFDERMVGLVLRPDGSVQEGRKPQDVDPDKEPDALLLYQCLDESGNVVAYTFPIQGQGLWSTCYGYFALEGDLDHVRGITFYKHGETPGLGGEIEQSWFQDQFVGKEVRDEKGEIVSVTVVKGSAATQHASELEHYVDGISGATITSKAVSDMIKSSLQEYEPYFGQIRQEVAS